MPGTTTCTADESKADAAPLWHHSMMDGGEGLERNDRLQARHPAVFVSWRLAGFLICLFVAGALLFAKVSSSPLSAYQLVILVESCSRAFCESGRNLAARRRIQKLWGRRRLFPATSGRGSCSDISAALSVAVSFGVESLARNSSKFHT